MGDLEVIWIVTAVVSIALIVCFFVLCVNVAEIKRSFLSDKDEYHIALGMGDKEKAYYHLQRDLHLQKFSTDFSEKKEKMFYDEFKLLGMGIPDVDFFEKYKDAEKEE